MIDLGHLLFPLIVSLCVCVASASSCEERPAAVALEEMRPAVVTDVALPREVSRDVCPVKVLVDMSRDVCPVKTWSSQEWAVARLACCWASLTMALNRST